MDVRIFKTKEEIAIAAADIFCETLQNKPDAVLGLATGSTPIPTYKELVWRSEQGLVDFSGARTFNLDEYCGLSADNEQSYRYFMQHRLFDKVGVKPENIHFFDGLAQDTLAECARYEAKIKSLGPIDLQLLGLGVNGHIGFNEPAEKMHAHCFRVDLARETIESNCRFFKRKQDVPTCALTMGLGTILSAKKILLIATGEEKTAAVYGMLRGEIGAGCPASFLRTHGSFVAMLDEAAAKRI